MTKTKLLFLFITCLISFESYSQKNKADCYYLVTRIIDGDTFRINDGSESGLTIRLIGIDAPESRNSRNRKKSEFGDDATVYLARIIEEKEIRLKYDLDSTDMYGRTLAYVYTKGGRFINAKMLRAGWGEVLIIKPNTLYERKFHRIEERAKKKGRGIWVKQKGGTS